MNKRFLLNGLLILGFLGALVSCEKNNSEVSSDKEEAFKQAVMPYVNNTVVATYSAMADAGMLLVEQCEQIADKVEAGQDYTALMAEAGASWRAMRKH